MNISLTWANYALIVSVCLVMYYLAVLFFYRKSFSFLSVNKITNTSHSLSELPPEETEPTNSKNFNLFGEEMKEENLDAFDEDQNFTPGAQTFADEIQAYTSSCGGDVGKEELIQHLRKIIHKYPSIINSDAEYELSQLIAISSENNCSIHLSADELRELWNG